MFRDVIYKLLNTRQVQCGELFLLLLSCTHDGQPFVKDPNKSRQFVNLQLIKDLFFPSRHHQGAF